jgi:hypothetical protein
MDTQVIGRLKIRGQPEPATPDIRAILVRDLTPETHGNAAGMGLADILLRTAFSRIDFRATYANVMTTGFPERGKLPMVAETDAEALQWAFRMAGMPGPAEARVLRIRNTLRLDRLQASPAAVEALRGRADITIEGPVEPVFTPDGAFAPW